MGISETLPTVDSSGHSQSSSVGQVDSHNELQDHRHEVNSWMTQPTITTLSVRETIAEEDSEGSLPRQVRHTGVIASRCTAAVHSIASSGKAGTQE